MSEEQKIIVSECNKGYNLHKDCPRGRTGHKCKRELGKICSYYIVPKSTGKCIKDTRFWITCPCALPCDSCSSPKSCVLKTEYGI